MPFLLNDRDFLGDLTAVRSVLIVPCRFCPAASLAVRTKTAYLKLSRGLRTPPYESYISALKSHLEQQGIKTGVFDSKLPHHFVMCMWPSNRREALAREAKRYDAMIVLGCDAAVETVRSCAGGCRVVPGIAVEGVMNVVPKLRFPADVYLEVKSVTRVLQPDPSTASAGSSNGQ